ncbi:MAG: SDR family oxidoreductase [Desulfobulbaceae bacterium]|jgi:3-oxoacyl-[acyl-carrier protein] reductase|nr:SDR family oxidoreductase [Desulfobulbaceae bacterium]
MKKGSMMSDKKLAVLTGAAGGLGVAASRALGKTGVKVVLTDMAADKAEAAAAALRTEGIDALGVGLNVTDCAAVDRFITELVKTDGRLNILVNLAGVVRNDYFTKVKNEDFDLTFASHVKGTMYCMRAALPIMRAQKYGRIINMSSIASRGALGGTSYSAAKGAIEAMSRTAAIESAAKGITVNCVAPGMIAAGMFLTTPTQFQDASIARTPMKRAGTPEEVAHCIAFFASPEASFVTGQTLFICGGLSIG